MPKKKAAGRKPPPKRKRRGKRKAVIALTLVLSLGLAGIIIAGWRSSRMTSYIPPLPQALPTPRLYKEYIYAGGKLVATEEPGGTSPLSAPSSLTAVGDSTPSAKVMLSWTASPGGTVDHYQVERCQNYGQNCYSFVADVATTSPTVTYTDNSVTANHSYLYRVRAVDSLGNFTGYSNVDLATAITFADDPLNAGGTRTAIQAVHLVELRRAVNGVRALANLGAASWTYPDPVSSPPEQRRKIYLEDVTDLRSRLDDALTVLGMSQSYPSDPPLVRGGAVYAEHFKQIRDRVN